MPSIFTRIIRGEIPCHKLHEDALTLAFLDINPISRGHTLLIPKQEAVTIADLDDAHAAALGRALPRVCRAVQAATGCAGYNLLQNNGELAGQVVPHAHIHIIPRYATPPSGLTCAWPAGKLDAGDAAALVQAVRAALA